MIPVLASPAPTDATKTCRHCGRELTAEMFRNRPSTLARAVFCNHSCRCAYFACPDRFWARVRKCAGDGCWEWAGRLNSSKPRHNYGRVSWDGREYLAPRLALILSGVDVPADRFVCHHCDNPLCVRPDHLFIATQSENVRDSIQKGRFVIPRGGRKGHPNRWRETWKSATVV